MRKYFFAAIAAATALGFSSCRNDELVIDEPINSEAEIGSIKDLYTFTDEKGNEIQNVGGSFGTYYMHINTDGAWKLSTDDVFVTLTKTHGVGKNIVPVYFAENWQGEDRNGKIKIQVENQAKTRSTDTSVDSTIIKQYMGYSISDLENRISSNIATGYGYRFESSTLVMNPTIEIFNMVNVVKDGRYVRDDNYPSAYETRYSSSTRDSLNQQISGSGHINAKWGGFKLGINGGANIGSTEDEKNEYAAMHASRTYFTRQIEWANALADHGTENQVLSSGFVYLRERLTKEIKEVDASSLDEEVKRKKINGIVSDFVESVGSVFVSKSSVGASFDYIMAVDKTFLNDSITARATLDLGYSKKVKNEEEEEEKAKKDSINSANGTVDGTFSRLTEKAYERSSAEISVFGGDVDKVSILARGGSLDMSTFQAWLQSVKPENCVVSDMQFVSIQVLIEDVDVRRYVRNYIERADCMKDE